jgi:guanosine-3',5'-bis(diphosphate) 3'-pyrophosphohydrolase
MNKIITAETDFSEIESFEQFKSIYEEFRGDLPENIYEAYKFAAQRHSGQKRVKSGQDYIIHPLTVATYALRIDLDDTAIIAAFLHDTVEDTNTTLDEIEKLFGIEVAYLVDCLTDVTDVSDLAEFNEDLLNSRRVVIQAANDIRVILIKLCDKMHNLLTQTDEKKVKSALKVEKIWEPLSEYVGLQLFKRKFQDEVFKILDPENYYKSKEVIQKLVEEQKPIFDKFLFELQDLFSKNHIENFNIEFRIKSIHSFFEKLRRKQKVLNYEDLSKIRDIFGCRIMVNDTQDCYLGIGLIHSTYEYLPNEYDDYIARPKQSGYRSLQTTVKFEKIYCEIQIKTYAMHEFNEYGPASHFAYKEKTLKSEDYYWVKELNESTQKTDNKIKVFSNSVFAFTPKGKVIRLDTGSTPLDFAYSVHSDIGDKFVGAKVNGKIVDIKYILKTGDICEILTSPHSSAKRDWLRIVKMAKTKHQIRRRLI